MNTAGAIWAARLVYVVVICLGVEDIVRAVQTQHDRYGPASVEMNVRNVSWRTAPIPTSHQILRGSLFVLVGLGLAFWTERDD